MRKSALYGFGLVVTMLVALGLIVLSSASEAMGVRRYHDAYFFIKRQFAYLGVGIILAAIVAKFDYHKWRDIPALTWAFFGIVFLLLLAVFPPLGRMINGSYRWINLGPINLQPSEFAKIVIAIVLAMWFDRAGWKVELWWKGMIWPAVITAVLAGPVILEPDFGSTVVIGLVAVLLMFIAGVKLLHVIIIGCMGGAVVAVKVLSNANRMARMAAWVGVKLNVGAEVANQASINAAHQGKMALVAIANGGLTGVGLNQSMQKHAYLPEAHTDMIFAIGAEELGLAFSVGVMILYVAFFIYAMYISSKAEDRFGRYLVMGMAFIIFFQAMFNIGVVCSALPMKGMALPFFSYGGTNMMSAFFIVGTILSVGIHSYRDRKRIARSNYG